MCDGRSPEHSKAFFSWLEVSHRGDRPYREGKEHTPFPPDIIMTGGDGFLPGPQATGQLKFCYLPCLTLSPMSASNLHFSWMLEQMGPIGREGRKCPGVHYLGCGPFPHRQASVSSPGPEWAQLSVSLHTQDPVVSEPQGSPCFCHPGVWITNVCYSVCLSMFVLGTELRSSRQLLY